jgi:hypothetical protein
MGFTARLSILLWFGLSSQRGPERGATDSDGWGSYQVTKLVESGSGFVVVEIKIT